jgi:hypothetical protein
MQIVLCFFTCQSALVVICKLLVANTVLDCASNWAAIIRVLLNPYYTFFEFFQEHIGSPVCQSLRQGWLAQSISGFMSCCGNLFWRFAYRFGYCICLISNFLGLFLSRIGRVCHWSQFIGTASANLRWVCDLISRRIQIFDLIFAYVASNITYDN